MKEVTRASVAFYIVNRKVNKEHVKQRKKNTILLSQGCNKMVQDVRTTKQNLMMAKVHQSP